MATYAIGDIQGCHDELMRLVEKIEFDPSRDRLWFVGDLVNRGPNSLETMMYVHGLGNAAVVVLGNHDLHLLACAYVDKYAASKKDTFQDVLESPHRDELLTWLRRQPILHRDEQLAYTLVHAGIPPMWTPAEAANYASEVESTLRGDNFRAFFGHMYGNTPDQWDPALTGWNRLRLITNFLTRLRYCADDDRMDFEYKGPVGSQPRELTPWYERYQRLPPAESIVFGHWSALHLSAQEMQRKRIYALDTGAVWGGTLTAMRLEDRCVYSVPSSVALPISD